MREPLKTRSGCVTCKKRRKKCDEKHPVCGSCARLRLACRWPEVTGSHQDEDEARQGDTVINPINTEEIFPQINNDHLRVADFNPTQTPTHFTLEAITIPFEAGQLFPASSTDFGLAFDEHVIICGIFKGWETVQRQFQLDSQWEHISFLDEETAKYGHGPVARMAIIWSWRTMMRYTAEGDLNRLSLVPSWYIPRQSQLDSDHPAIIDYFPWPAVRERLMYHQDEYLSGEWISEYMKDGFRFLWPYRPQDAFTWDSEKHMVQVSPEFRMRVQNLRSYTLTRDFLEQYGEFRGEAPQLEPSISTRQPLMDRELEKTYWSVLRERSVRTPGPALKVGRKKKTRDVGQGGGGGRSKG